MRIYRRHLVDRDGRMCSRGARIWWQRAGLSWSEFIEYGIEEDDLLKAANGDIRAAEVIERAKRGQE